MSPHAPDSVESDVSATWPEHFREDLMRPAFGTGILSSYAICLEAWRRGLRVTVKHPDWMRYEISDGENTVSFSYSRPNSLTPRSVHEIVENKYRTTQTLARAGVPVPQAHLFDPDPSLWSISSTSQCLNGFQLRNRIV